MGWKSVSWLSAGQQPAWQNLVGETNTKHTFLWQRQDRNNLSTLQEHINASFPHFILTAPFYNWVCPPSLTSILLFFRLPLLSLKFILAVRLNGVEVTMLLLVHNLTCSLLHPELGKESLNEFKHLNSTHFQMDFNIPPVYLCCLMAYRAIKKVLKCSHFELLTPNVVSDTQIYFTCFFCQTFSAMTKYLLAFKV